MTGPKYLFNSSESLLTALLFPEIWFNFFFMEFLPQIMTMAQFLV